MTMTPSAIPSAIGLPADQVRALLTAAASAPSLHNTQPWRFRLTATAIELHADQTRQLPVADPDGLALRLGCGAALFNLRMALAGLGVRPVVAIFPDRDRPGLVATVRHGGPARATPELERLLRAIPRRHTNRRPFSDAPVAASERQSLCGAADQEGARLHLVEDPAQRVQLGRMAMRAHQIQIADPAFGAELAAWTGVTDDRADGVPARAGGPLPAPRDVWVARDFTGGRARTRRQGEDFEEQPLIAVVTSLTSGPEAEVRAGQAMQRVLLTATAEGLAVSFVSQLVEVPEICAQTQQLINGLHPPLVVLRIGRGWPIAATPRRPAEDVMLIEPTQPVVTPRSKPS